MGTQSLIELLIVSYLPVIVPPILIHRALRQTECFRQQSPLSALAHADRTNQDDIL
jgi:hypothetical protein